MNMEITFLEFRLLVIKEFFIIVTDYDCGFGITSVFRERGRAVQMQQFDRL